MLFKYLFTEKSQGYAFTARVFSVKQHGASVQPRKHVFGSTAWGVPLPGPRKCSIVLQMARFAAGSRRVPTCIFNHTPSEKTQGLRPQPNSNRENSGCQASAEQRPRKLEIQDSAGQQPRKLEIRPSAEQEPRKLEV